MRVRVTAWRAAALCVLACASITATASAVVNQPPSGGHTVEVFPDSDIVIAGGYEAGQSVTVRVLRNGVQVGVAQSVATSGIGGGGAGLVEVNHPPLPGEPENCWTSVTPDIRAGDVIQVLTAPDTGDQITVANIKITSPIEETAPGSGTVVMKGTAQDANGNPLPLDALEARLVSGGNPFQKSGRRDLRAPGQGTVSYDAPGSVNWTVTFPDLTQADVTRAILAAAEFSYLGATPALENEGTHAEWGVPGGPEAPCTAPLAKGPSTPDMSAASDLGASSTDNVTSNASPTFTGVAGAAAVGDTITLLVDGVAAGTGTVQAGLSWSITPTAPIGDGVHQVVASETVDTVTTTSQPLSVTIDTAAPGATLTAAPAALTNQANLSFGFSSNDPNATFRCALAQLAPAAFGPCTSPQSYTGLADGSYTFAVQAVDVAGNTSAPDVTHSFTVDATAPGVSITSGPEGPQQADSATFAFGSADAGAAFACSLVTTESPDSFAECGSPATYAGPLAEGAYTFKVRATDAAGNQSVASRAFTVDRTAPTATIQTGPNAVTNDRTPAFAFSASEGGAGFQCSVVAEGSPASFTACASGFEPAALADGSYVFSVKATDAAGNTGTAVTRSFAVDTAPPSARITSNPASPSTDNAPVFVFESDDPGATLACSFTTSATPSFGPCTSPKTYTGQADGEYTFTVRATDTAGSSSTDSAELVIDTTGPATTLGSKPAAASSDATPSFGFTAEPGASFECSLTSGGTDAFVPCDSPRTYGGQPDGPYTFKVRALDVLGNVGAVVSHTFVIDTAAPAAPSLNGTTPASPSSVNSPLVTGGAETGSTVRLYATANCTATAVLGSAAALAAPGLSVTVPSDAATPLSASATDAAGNVSPCSAAISYIEDSTAPPAPGLSSLPGNPTGDNTPTFAFTNGEPTAALTCSLTGGTDSYAPCSSPFTPSGQLGDGSYIFKVRATDQAGNVSTAAAFAFVVDTGAPTAAIQSTPAALTTSRSPSFTFTSNDPQAAFECSLSTGTDSFTSCSSPKAYTGQADGDYTFKVRAVDTAGNAGAAASYAFAIDGTGPTATIVGAPPSPTSTRTPEFDFASNEPGSTFECSLSTGADAYAPCTSPKAYSERADGTYTFKVRATDQAGNVGAPASAVHVISTPAFAVTITGAPTDPTADTTPDFAFSANRAATFRCSLVPVGGLDTLGACSSPVTFGPLAPGQYRFMVEATDGSMNTITAAQTFTISTPGDTTAPVVTAPVPSLLTTQKMAQNGASVVTLSWTGSDSSGIARYDLQQKTGTGAFTNVALGNLKAVTINRTLVPGTYTFRVRGTDTKGNVGAWVTAAAFTVGTRQDNVAGQITFGGAWTSQKVTAAAGGTQRFSVAANATATASFTGSYVSWVSSKGPNRGRADVFIDGVRVATLNLYASAVSQRAVVFARALTPGAHTIQVKVLGSRVAPSTGNQVYVDAFAFLT